MGANTAVQTNKKTFGQWLRSRKGQQTVIIVAFIIIPLLLLFTFTYLPFAEMVKFSFYKMKYVGARKFGIICKKGYSFVLEALPLLYGRSFDPDCSGALSCDDSEYEGKSKRSF